MLVSLLSYILGKGIISPREKNRTFEGPPHSTLVPAMQLLTVTSPPHPLKTRNVGGSGYKRVAWELLCI